MDIRSIIRVRLILNLIPLYYFFSKFIEVSLNLSNNPVGSYLMNNVLYFLMPIVLVVGYVMVVADKNLGKYLISIGFLYVIVENILQLFSFKLGDSIYSIMAFIVLRVAVIIVSVYSINLNFRKI